LTTNFELHHPAEWNEMKCNAMEHTYNYMAIGIPHPTAQTGVNFPKLRSLNLRSFTPKSVYSARMTPSDCPMAVDELVYMAFPPYQGYDLNQILFKIGITQNHGVIVWGK
jgi:hypothetical protein